MKKLVALSVVIIMCLAILTGCSSGAQTADTAGQAPAATETPVAETSAAAEAPATDPT